jgi:hypothetical protein
MSQSLTYPDKKLAIISTKIYNLKTYPLTTPQQNIWNLHNTTQYMHEIVFNWTKINSSYLEKYVKYFRDIGYFGDENYG